jgi:hypothetical protein
MSKFVKIQTELRDVQLIKRALDDLNISYQENAQFVHRWSGFAGTVPLVVQTRGAHFGLRETTDGAYEIIGDDMHMRGLQPSIDALQQRYAYHKVLAEVAKAGFDLVEETTGKDNVIRMTVRRWQ